MRLVSILALFLLLPFGFAHSQTFDAATFEASLASVQINLNPSHPRPNQTIQANVTSVSEDIRAATVVWILDGEVTQESKGNEPFTLTVGEVGDIQSLQVLVKSPSGIVLRDVVTINPTHTALVWEARTYTPPLYEGRALYTTGSLIVAEAYVDARDVNGARIDPKALIYTWSRNGSVLGAYSGRGSQSIEISGPKFLGRDLLSVEVALPTGEQISNTGALIDTIDPLILLYEKDPLTGVEYHRAVRGSESLNSSTQVQAVPYYMATRNANGASLEYKWRINGKSVRTDAQEPSVLSILLNDSNGFGVRISLVVDHVQHLLQTGSGQWTAQFESSGRGSLFGL